jgi:signal transduction histidine kinase/ActR/RegA family two-component response regulator
VPIPLQGLASDTIKVTEDLHATDLSSVMSYYEDRSHALTIDSVLPTGNPPVWQQNPIGKSLNFGFSPSHYWLRFSVKNTSSKNIDYILKIANPDLDYIEYYEFTNGDLDRKVLTGELMDVKSREIFHRNFLFNLESPPNTVKTVYLCANNNGHAFFIPAELIEKSDFDRKDIGSEMVFWLIYGLLLFMILYNVYLYYITRDKVNLYYFLYLIFATLTLFSYDGYPYFFNPPVIAEKFKWINPSLYIVFLLSFTQAFTNYDTRFRKLRRYINPFKVIAIVAVLFYQLPYPVSLVADVGIPILILSSLILIIVISAMAIKKSYPPSTLLFLGYLFIFIGFFINELKEFNLVSNSYLVENSSKFGQTLECILLTVAVLERFRINMNNDKQLIRDNLARIEVQNRELEIINTELEKLSIVASETDNSIAIYDSSGRLEWANAGFEKLYEVNINKLIQEQKDRIEMIIPNPDIGRYMNKCLISQTSVGFETQVPTEGHGHIWVQTTLSPFIRSGRISKIISIDSDISNLKQYEKELELAKEKAEESDRLKTAFLHNISHEIRTPMNAIVGFSGLLNDTELDPDKRSQYTEIIVQSSNHLLSVITDIMRIASIEAGQEDIVESQFDLNVTLEFLFEQYLLKARDKEILLEFEPENGLEPLEIISDETKLIQILTNLLDNALKFTRKGSVSFGYEIREGFIEFYVRDNGIGIAPEMHEVIFKRFHQVESTNTRKFGGSGLGLAISKAYVELLGGSIWLESELGTGSVFHFSIPLIRGRKKSHHPAGSPEKDVKPFRFEKTILVAEDDDSNYRLLEEQLSYLSVKIIRAKNGAEAVDICKSHHIDLVLMDIKMPVLDGYEATRQIREYFPALPIIAQTAYHEENDQNRAMQAGCNDFISKPVHQDYLHSVIRARLEVHSNQSLQSAKNHA